MIRALALLLSAALLLVLHEGWWRRHRRLDAVHALLGLGWMAWATEVGLTAFVLLQPAPPPATERATLPDVAGHPVTVDHGAEAEDRPTIALLGDSFAWGQGVPEDEALAARLEAALPGRPRVLLLAAPGRSFFDSVAVHDAIAVPASADVVVWLFVLNDLGLPQAADDWIDASTEGLPAGPVTPRVVQRILRAPEQTALTERAYRVALDPEGPRFQRMVEMLGTRVAHGRAAGVRHVWAIHPLLHDLSDYPFEAQHEALRQAAEAVGAEVVDLLPALSDQPAHHWWVHPADHHPNAAAHGRVAEALVRQLGEVTLAPTAPCRTAGWPASTGAALGRACRQPGADTLLSASETLLEHPPGPPVAPLDAPHLAADLAVVGAWRARDVDAPVGPAIRAHAADLVARARQGTPRPARPEP